MTEYFNEIAQAAALEGDHITVTQHRSGRVRGGCTYTSAANTYFQGLCADGALASLVGVSHECYNVPESPLFHSRIVAFIHDEIILESPKELAAAAAKRLSEVMVEKMAIFIPDIPIRADSHIMDRWYKDAEPTFDSSGVLIPWTPKP